MKRGLRRHGLTGAARHAASRLGGRFYLREAHHWYQLDLGADRPQRPMPEGFRLVQGGEDELLLLRRLPTVKLEEGERRLGDGATLWLVLEAEDPAFACWTFYDRMPVYAAKGGALELPQRAAGLEDSVTSPDYRGRGVAPAAWAAISDTLHERGYELLITKVAEENQPSRRAVEKAGFRDIAVMRLIRFGRRRRVEVEPTEEPVGRYLAERLGSPAG